MDTILLYKLLMVDQSLRRFRARCRGRPSIGLPLIKKVFFDVSFHIFFDVFWVKSHLVLCLQHPFFSSFADFSSKTMILKLFKEKLLFTFLQKVCFGNYHDRNDLRLPVFRLRDVPMQPAEGHSQVPHC